MKSQMPSINKYSLIVIHKSIWIASLALPLPLSLSLHPSVGVAVYGVAVVVQSSRCWWWSSAGAVFRRMHACPVSVCVPVLGGPILHKVQALNLSFLNCDCACYFFFSTFIFLSFLFPLEIYAWSCVYTSPLSYSFELFTRF